MSAPATIVDEYRDLPRLSRGDARAAAKHLLAMQGEGVEVEEALRARIERFYFREARLLDEERFDDWYELLADDLFYWLPLHQNRYRRDPTPALAPDNMALFDECKADMAIRIGRLASKLVWTEDPPTRHTYVISNVEAFMTSKPDAFEVHSTFIQYRNRSEHDATVIHGRRRDLVRMSDEGFKIVSRLILLPQSVLLSKNLSAFF